MIHTEVNLCPSSILKSLKIFKAQKQWKGCHFLLFSGQALLKWQVNLVDFPASNHKYKFLI